MTAVNGFSCKRKSRNLGSDIPYWVRKQYEIEDAEYLAQIFAIRNDQVRPVAKLVKNAVPKLSGFAEPETSILEFLGEHLSLVDVLKNAAGPLASHFGSNLVCAFDLLEEGHHRKLFVKIPTKLSAGEALKHLDSFDKTFWFKQNVEARRFLEFVLDFQ